MDEILAPHDEILALHQAFEDGELRADTDRLQALLADDFLSIGERGYVFDKPRWIARHGDFRFLSVETTELDVRRYERAAIVRGVQHGRATWLGEPVTLNVRLSEVWVEQADGWHLAALQFSPSDGA